MISNIEEILAAYRKGEMVILIDDENRENEGDLLAPSSLITPEHINFMSKHARGLICLTLTEKRCDYLNLPLMVSSGNNLNHTHFTVSIESATGVTTGISAADRAHTILTAVDQKTTAKDIVCPGHIFPLRARDGGVLVRAGHTEAGCDLAQLAGMKEYSSVIVEIMNEDGSMARLPNLKKFSKKHNIKLGTIADLIHYRLENEQLMTEVSKKPVQINGKEFQVTTYFDNVDKLEHHALTLGDISNINDDEVIIVRVQLQNYLHDVFDLNQNNQQTSGWDLKDACQHIANQNRGIIVLLNNEASALSHDNKNYGKGSQILNALNVNKIEVLGSKLKYSGIEGFGLKVENFLSRDSVEL